MTNSKAQNQPRKPSWHCLDLAFKIQFPRRYLAAKLVLLFLAKSVNDSLRAYPRYDTVMAHTGSIGRKHMCGEPIAEIGPINLEGIN
jgi:hypothetical protein